MARVIKVNVLEKEKNLNEKIPVNTVIKKNVPDVEELPKAKPSTHMLLTVLANGWARMPEVGEKVSCKKQLILPLGYNGVTVSNAEHAICGYIFANDTNVLHGTTLTDEGFDTLPEQFCGTVVEIGGFPNNHLMMIVVECPAKTLENAYTVVMPGQTLLAPFGSTFTAKKSPRLSGSAAVFDVYDGTRKIGIISPLQRMTIPGTETLSLMEANSFPDSFVVKVVGDGNYDDSHRAIIVELVLDRPYKASAEEIAAKDKKILKKYLAYLLREGECSTMELMLLSETGKQKKAMLDKKYKEIMQTSENKLRAYFDLL